MQITTVTATNRALCRDEPPSKVRARRKKDTYRLFPLNNSGAECEESDEERIPQTRRGQNRLPDNDPILRCLLCGTRSLAKCRSGHLSSKHVVAFRCFCPMRRQRLFSPLGFYPRVGIFPRWQDVEQTAVLCVALCKNLSALPPYDHCRLPLVLLVADCQVRCEGGFDENRDLVREQFVYVAGMGKNVLGTEPS